MTETGKATVSRETFDEFLAGQGLLEACEEHAVKERVAEQIATEMAAQRFTKVEMAARMETSRRQLDRLFDPTISSVTSGRVASHGERGRALAADRTGVKVLSPHCDPQQTLERTARSPRLMTQAYIIDYTRTPIGRFGGALSGARR